MLAILGLSNLSGTIISPQNNCAVKNFESISRSAHVVTASDQFMSPEMLATLGLSNLSGTTPEDCAVKDNIIFTKNNVRRQHCCNASNIIIFLLSQCRINLRKPPRSQEKDYIDFYISLSVVLLLNNFIRSSRHAMVQLHIFGYLWMHACPSSSCIVAWLLSIVITAGMQLLMLHGCMHGCMHGGAAILAIVRH